MDLSYRVILILLIVLAVILLVVVVLQISLYRKLKARNKLVLSQSRKIKNQNLELEKQNKELVVLDQEKQQIVSVVSHDLKGPFNRIFALVQLMSASVDNLTEDQKEYMGKIHQIVSDGLSMIRNLLDNRRLEDHEIELTPKALNLSAFISTFIKNYRTLAEKKKIQIHAVIPEGIGIEVDKSYLMRIIENLLSNAVKFSSPDSNVYVTLADRNDEVELAVADEGPGLSDEDQKKLFQKYQRLTPKPTGGESTTGLGLFIVKTIIEKMDGAVRCESEQGKGSKFIVTLRRNQLNK
ncbi:MAG TPA: HAMP domain-containing sensor histidine kinase [Cyclobacteriaceae bacterium]|nr:HAMP domain-containing sensor histidine kinase [Cyclobacteriaceae bacterium]